MRHLFLCFSLFALLFLACSPTEVEPTGNTSYEDIQAQFENPGIAMQQQAIQKHGIRKCTITEWENSPNEDSLVLKDRTMVIHYNLKGDVDSSIQRNHALTKTTFTYNNQGQLIEKVYRKSTGWPANVNSYEVPNEETHYNYTYDAAGNLATEKLRLSSQKQPISITYQWKNHQLQTIEIHNPEIELRETQSFNYEDSRLVKRITTSSKNGASAESRTNVLRYEQGNLVEVTNTWLIPLERVNDQLENAPNAETLTPDDLQLTSTLLSYTNNGRIKSHQKTHGLWFGESVWKTTYRYLENSLIQEEELHNDHSVGHTKIIKRYQYE